MAYLSELVKFGKNLDFESYCKKEKNISAASLNLQPIKAYLELLCLENQRETDFHQKRVNEKKICKLFLYDNKSTLVFRSN